MKKDRYDSPNIRKGRFMWMEPDDQKMYINTLKSRIAEGYYFSETILTKVADELTPVLSEISGDR